MQQLSIQAELYSLLFTYFVEPAHAPSLARKGSPIRSRQCLCRLTAGLVQPLQAGIVLRLQLCLNLHLHIDSSSATEQLLAGMVNSSRTGLQANETLLLV